MRPGQHQQNRRGRGRHNGNNNSNSNNGGGNQSRKNQNPLTRSFESNGPDVKVRGTPAHIAEKYLALARDAQSTGDTVLAESYLQHAEHYNRIIMAYREQFQTPGEQGPQQQRRMPGTDGLDNAGEFEGGGEDGDGGPDDYGSGPQPQSAQGPAMNNQGGSSGYQGGFEGGGAPPNQQQNRPQYRQDNQNRYDRNGNGDRNGGDNGQRGDRPYRRDGQPQNNRFRDRNDRNDRNRPYGNGSQPNGERNYEPRFERGPRQDRPVRVDRGEGNERMPQQPGPGPMAIEQQQPPANLPPIAVAPVDVAPPPIPAAVPAHQPAPAPAARRRAAEAAAPGSDAPEFLRRPVRRPRPAAAEPAVVADTPKPTNSDDGG